MRIFRIPLALGALAGLLFCAAAPVRAATLLYDFEDPDEFADWRPYGLKIAPNTELATQGKTALGARVPAYVKGHWEWTSFEMKSAKPQDWTGYNRLVIDLRSNSRGQFKFNVFICDRFLNFRDHGFNFEFTDPPVMGAKRYVIPLTEMPNSVDLADMAMLHFFFSMPPVDVDVAIDRIMLLAPGDTLEPLDPNFARRESAGVPEPLLFDFEEPDSLDYWTNNQHLHNELDRNAQNATSGQMALRFFTPKYDFGKGVPGWPSFEYNAPKVMDWRPYDRLVFDVANPNPTATMLAVYISDDRTPYASGLMSGQPPDHTVPMRIEPMANIRFTVDLTRFPGRVDRSRIAVLNFWSRFSAGDTTIYLDNFRLLKPGEGQPPADPAMIAATRKRLLESVPPPPAARPGGFPAHAAAVAAYRAEYDKLHAAPPAVDENPDDPGGVIALSGAVLQMPIKHERLAAILDWEKADPGDSAFVLGHGTAMKKIFPRGRTPNVLPLPADGPLRLSCARRENESTQIAVLPRKGDLKNVAVAVGELRDGKGNVFPAGAIDVDVVGFVHIPASDLYVKRNYVGWWPDPILDWLKTVDVAVDDVQPFWVRFRCPEGQEPGVYTGEITVAADGPGPDGRQTRDIPFELTVRNFTLPIHSPLPLAVNTFWHIGLWKLGKERWEMAKPGFVKVLERYWLPYDQPCMVADFDVLEDQMHRGLLGGYNLDYMAAEYIKEGGEKGAEIMLDRLGPLVEEARERNMLDHAYAYGFDELPMQRGGDAGRVADVIKDNYPDLFLLTTAYDKSLGAPGSPMESFDGFCPLSSEYSIAKADEARARGKKVWWYVCIGPPQPWGNFFANQHSISGRMLMGALSAKFRPDGFLYWSLLYWEERHKQMTKWPFTDWDARSFGTTYGDGQWFCWGPDDRFVPTMRLENFRDGLEDYAYYKILEATLAAAEAEPKAKLARTKAWRKQAAEALEISEELAAHGNKFTRDPAVLAAWREGMGKALDSAPLPPANPWGDFFGPRGFPYDTGGDAD